jgi:cell wall-associated NlpC family hydrolase
MVTRKDIVDKAREFIETPFHHQGRLKHIGIDCVGLIYCVAKELGIKIHDKTDYGRAPRPDVLLTEIRKSLDEISIEEANIGDIFIFWIKRKSWPQHVAIISDYGMIHAYADIKKVVEHVIDEKWTDKIKAAFRYRGIE